MPISTLTCLKMELRISGGKCREKAENAEKQLIC